MFIKELVIIEYIGIECHKKRAVNPLWENIEQAIKKLAGEAIDIYLVENIGWMDWDNMGYTMRYRDALEQGLLKEPGLILNLPIDETNIDDSRIIRIIPEDQQIKSGSYMSISGGFLGYYLCSVETGKSNYLVDPDNPNEEIEVMVGGQAGYFSARQLVKQDTLLKAAKLFADTGQIDASLCWTEDRNLYSGDDDEMFV